MAATVALPLQAILVGLVGAAAKTILLQQAVQALPVKGMLATGMAVLLIAHILLVAAGAQAQQVGLQRVIQWPGAGERDFPLQLPDQRYFMQAAVAAGYIFLAELLALAEVEAGELDHQILPLEEPER